MKDSINEKLKNMQVGTSAHYQSANLFYVVAAILIVVSIVFIAWPMLSQISEKSSLIAASEESTTEMKSEINSLGSEIDNLNNSVKNSRDQINEAMRSEILPSEPKQTEFTRFMEHKVNGLNVSNQNSLTLDSISYRNKESDIAGLSAMEVKMSLAGSEYNFYRFLQELENNGSVIEVKKVSPESPLFEKVQKGDIIKSIKRNCNDDGENCEVTPVIYGWIAVEDLKKIEVGETGTYLVVRRFDPMEKAWKEFEVEYTPVESTPDAIDSEGNNIYLDNGVIEKDPMVEFDLSDDYTRLISVETVSNTLKDGDEVTGEGTVAEFSIELNAYYKE